MMRTLLKTLVLLTVIFTFSNCTTESLNDFQDESATELETNDSFLEFFNDSSETIFIRNLNQEQREGDGAGAEETGAGDEGVVEIRPGSKTKTKTSAIGYGETTFNVIFSSMSGRAADASTTITVIINIEEGYDYYFIINEDLTVSVIAEEL